MKINFKQCFDAVVSGIKKATPTILIIGGTSAVAYSAYKAAEVAPQAKEVIDDFKANREEIDNREDLTPEERQVEIKEGYKELGTGLVKLYAKPVAGISIGVAMIFGAHGMMTKQIATLTAGLTSLDKMYNNYRNNVIEKYGEDEDFRLRNNIKTVEIQDIEQDVRGRKRKVKKEVDIVDPETVASPFQRFFDESNPNFSKNPQNNLFFLKKVEQFANDRLVAQGYLFLNDVLYELGYNRCAEGQVYGWTYDPDDPNCHNHVDLGIHDIRRKTVQNFVNGYEPVVMLDINSDEIVYNKLPSFKAI